MIPLTDSRATRAWPVSDPPLAAPAPPAPAPTPASTARLRHTTSRRFRPLPVQEQVGFERHCQ